MWLDLKKCTFVIFVITMFSLLAVQPAFSLESDFVSTGNSTVGVPSTTSYANLLNDINGAPITDNGDDKSIKYKFGEVAGDKNKVILHQSEGSEDILNNPGAFNITFKVPKGHRFTFNIVIKSGSLTSTHSNITIKGGVGENMIDPGIGDHSFFWKKENGSISHGDKPPQNMNEWFYTESDDYTININGHRGIKLEFYIIFNDSVA